MSGSYNVAWLCEALMVSRSGYYDWLRRQRTPSRRERENRQLTERIREVFTANRCAYGSPRIARELGGIASRNRVARLMRRQMIFARQRSKYRPQTTNSRHGDPIAPNRLRNLAVVRADQAWATDATCVLTAQGWLYVVALIDLYTRRIVGWSMGATLDAELALAALRMALARRHPPPGLIVHSDRGVQFASAVYRAALARHGLVASMSRQGNCYDNAYIESFWSSMKIEAIFGRRFLKREEARSAVFDYIEGFYNPRRRHSALGYLSPINFESQLN
jgi:transposase InsO family protein